MKGKFIIICLGICFSSCYYHSERNIQSNNPEFIITELQDSFVITIIDYTPSFNCGTRAFASNCLGVMTQGDTIRVLTLCNTDSSFKSNQVVNVIPEKKPSFNVSISMLSIENMDTKYKTILYMEN